MLQACGTDQIARHWLFGSKLVFNFCIKFSLPAIVMETYTQLSKK